MALELEDSDHEPKDVGSLQELEMARRQDLPRACWRSAGLLTSWHQQSETHFRLLTPGTITIHLLCCKLLRHVLNTRCKKLK